MAMVTMAQRCRSEFINEIVGHFRNLYKVFCALKSSEHILEHFRREQMGNVPHNPYSQSNSSNLLFKFDAADSSCAYRMSIN